MIRLCTGRLLVGLVIIIELEESARRDRNRSDHILYHVVGLQPTLNSPHRGLLLVSASDFL